MNNQYQDAVRTLNRLSYLSAGGVPNPQAAARTPITSLTYASAGGPQSPHYVSAGTGAGGREDNIPAKLSEGEYVVDAETMALLGDGNTDKAAKKMDQFRANIRRHKGKSLSRGKISPDAYSDASQYMTAAPVQKAKGGKGASR